MKKLLLLLCLSPLTAIAAPVTDLVPTCMPAPCASIMESVLEGIGTDVPFENADWLSWRNALDSATLDAMRVDSGDSLEINAITGEAIELQINKTNRFVVNATSATSAGNITATAGGITATAGDITAAADDIVATLGDVIVDAGDVTVTLGNVDVAAGDITATLGAVAAGTTVTGGTGVTATTGNVTSTAGSFVAGTSGGTLHIQEATAGAKCMGTATANGVTAVTVSTTCALTASRIFISRTSAVAAGVTEPGCWATNIVNATSFDLDCNDAAENSTFNWIIFQEAA